MALNLLGFVSCLLVSTTSRDRSIYPSIASPYRRVIYGAKITIIYSYSLHCTAAAEVEMSSVTLSKEQVVILLPLLPTLAENLAGSSSPTLPSTSMIPPVENSEEILYTNAELFSRKKKNTRSTAAQNHLLVSIIVYNYRRLQYVTLVQYMH